MSAEMSFTEADISRFHDRLLELSATEGVQVLKVIEICDAVHMFARFVRNDPDFYYDVYEQPRDSEVMK